MRIQSQIEHAQDTLERIIGDMQHSAAALARMAADIVPSPQPGTQGTRLSDSQRQALQAHIQVALERHAWCHGAGFASYASPTATDNGYWTLEWWLREAGNARQAHLDQSQEIRQRLDFRTFDWFEQPARRHQPFVDGPYVDYVCNGAYTMTAAHPVMIGDAFAGVTAVDVLVSTLETLALPALTTISQPALVLNSDRRVIISTSPDIRTGDLWKTDRLPACPSKPGIPLQLVVLDDAPGLPPSGPR
ncbi:cache domain-containing protein [Corticimicrobacter populi]|uniref:Cache domain-containing protein n=1 Tax=Corticimicrobacter populi TaxID=2175229 RepID=A0A2V1K506_9BURK|nr:cache domain-containing protein [Corticimicrobacter populi]PWF23960.1 hypothetical protein DD235_06420 [Corticimicrobacter populi]QDQ88200.1 hypothetical protein FMZ60_11800 [Alcaligenaceae bacterium SJ-26]